MHKWIGVVLLAGWGSLWGQQPADSSLKALPPSRTVVIRSALLPGWGQWSNGAKWKAALVFGGELGLISAAVVQNQRAQQATVESEKMFYEDDRSRWVWIAGAVWLLNIVDAYVDAQLRGFDVGPTLALGPPGRCAAALSLSYSW